VDKKISFEINSRPVTLDQYAPLAAQSSSKNEVSHNFVLLMVSARKSGYQRMPAPQRQQDPDLAWAATNFLTSKGKH
jgi:hypothetical protein